MGGWVDSIGGVGRQAGRTTNQREFRSCYLLLSFSPVKSRHYCQPLIAREINMYHCSTL